MLIQEKPKKPEKSIEFWSRSLNDTKSLYKATEGECPAIVRAVLLLRPYLEDAIFTVVIDCCSSKWLLNVGGATGILEQSSDSKSSNTR